MIVAGPTMSGKSTTIKNLILLNRELISPVPERILWIYKGWQPLYDKLKYWILGIKFIQGITEEIKTDKYINSQESMLLVIDDMMKDATQDEKICELFTERAHRRNLSVICIMQNIVIRVKENRTMSLNSQYIVLFKNPRDRQQILILAIQMYYGNSNKLLDAYEKAVSVPHGSLTLNLKQTAPESKRFQTNIFRPCIRIIDNTSRHLTGPKQGDKTSVNTASYRSNFIQHPTDEMAYQQRLGTQQYYYPPSDSWTTPIGTRKYTENGNRGKIFILFGMWYYVCQFVYNLQRHTKNSCPMEEEESVAMSKVSDEDDDSGCTSLVNQVLEKN